MATYMGFITVHPDYATETAARQREGGHAAHEDERMIQRMSTMVDELPSFVKFIVTYSPVGFTFSAGPDPSVMIVEAEDARELLAVNRHYGGFLDIRWVPATARTAHPAAAAAG